MMIDKSKHGKYGTHSYMVMDGQYGSTGKGLLCGYLAETRLPTAIVSAYSPNAGHTYITDDGTRIVTTQIPIGAISPRARGIFIGPGSAINEKAMLAEIQTLTGLGLLDLSRTEIIIHEHAAVVLQADLDAEKSAGLATVGSTLKGGASANIRKMMRLPDGLGTYPVARSVLDKICSPLQDFVVSEEGYLSRLFEYGYITQIEGAQGFSLSMNRGFYPYVTSRDVTPHQIFNDCGIPWDLAKRTDIYQCLRTFPIRVNNREGTSGPGYIDQHELSWHDLGLEPELTTVTKLPRRIFSWSLAQLKHMVAVCGKPDAVFLNFANYCKSWSELCPIVTDIDTVCGAKSLRWLGYGPQGGDVEDLVELVGGRAMTRQAREIINHHSS